MQINTDSNKRVVTLNIKAIEEELQVNLRAKSNNQIIKAKMTGVVDCNKEKVPTQQLFSKRDKDSKSEERDKKTTGRKRTKNQDDENENEKKPRVKDIASEIKIARAITKLMIKIRGCAYIT